MTDCRWMNDNLEAYCCDRLTGDVLLRAKAHIESCASCREELSELNAIDPMVQELFRRRLVVARAPRTSRRLVPATAAVALAGGVLAVVLLIRPGTPQVEISAPPLAPQAVVVEKVAPKATGDSNVTRAKPNATAAAAPSPAVGVGPAPSAEGNGTEAFAVIDSAGYVRRLEDYRGNVVVVASWSPDQEQAAQNLEQIYRAFGRNTRFRLVGVLARRDAPPSEVTFPVVYNYDSRLLGLQESEFVVIDTAGEERLRGSLLAATTNLNQTVRTLLGP